MKLYSSRFAPSPRRVRMYAAEKGIALELVEVDIAAGATRAPAYLARNPLGDECYSSPAVSQGQLYIRTLHYLYCIGKK